MQVLPEYSGCSTRRFKGSLSSVKQEVQSNLWYKVHPVQKCKCFSLRLAVVFAQSIEARCYVENEDVVGAAPPGDAPTAYEWPTILLPAKVQLILEVWWYCHLKWFHSWLWKWRRLLSSDHMNCGTFCRFWGKADKINTNKRMLIQCQARLWTYICIFLNRNSEIYRIWWSPVVFTALFDTDT